MNANMNENMNEWKYGNLYYPNNEIHFFIHIRQPVEAVSSYQP